MSDTMSDKLTREQIANWRRVSGFGAPSALVASMSDEDVQKLRDEFQAEADALKGMTSE